jgi:hypothetical protein
LAQCGRKDRRKRFLNPLMAANRFAAVAIATTLALIALIVLKQVVGFSVTRRKAISAIRRVYQLACVRFSLRA